MKNFLNDNDGVSITDFICIVIITTFVAMIFIGALNPDYFENIKELLGVMEIPVSIIIAGYFSTGILNFIPFIKNLLSKK